MLYKNTARELLFLIQKCFMTDLDLQKNLMADLDLHQHCNYIYIKWRKSLSITVVVQNKIVTECDDM